MSGLLYALACCHRAVDRAADLPGVGRVLIFTSTLPDDEAALLVALMKGAA